MLRTEPLKIPRRYASLADGLIFLLIGAAIYGVFAMATRWNSAFHATTDIDLSVLALPHYTLYSLMRGLAAYVLSLTFTFVVGYAAAKSKRAETIIIPMCDILQTIPVLGFLPGLVLGLIAIFPATNIGLELACIIMIFTGQVWNMLFAFYSSLKSVPEDFNEAAALMGMSPWRKFLKVELPFAAVGLTWNSVISMAGGWFFLTVCEAFSLGSFQFQLPGLGSYMAVAHQKGDATAMTAGVIAMVLTIVLLDMVLWRPLLSWASRYRLEEVEGALPPEPLMLLMVRESRFLRWLKLTYRKRFGKRKLHFSVRAYETLPQAPLEDLPPKKKVAPRKMLKYLGPIFWIAFFAFIAIGCKKLIKVLWTIPSETWMMLIENTSYTFLRVTGIIVITCLWAIPVGLWIGRSQKRIQIFQPAIQILASFPAPMIYPIVLAVFLAMGIEFGWASMFLMGLGVQWFILFNVLAGAARIPKDLEESLKLMSVPRWKKWMILYVPSIFPMLVTGSLAAAGGAWNASIVTEYMSYNGEILTTKGLGAVISQATARGDFHTLAASLTVMVVVVLVVNRFFWAKLYHTVQTKYKLEAQR